MKKNIQWWCLTLVLMGFQCTDENTCSDRCELQPETGPCKAMFTRYYFDPDTKSCKPFVWGGCAGVVPFETLETCEMQCDCKN